MLVNFLVQGKGKILMLDLDNKFMRFSCVLFQQGCLQAQSEGKSRTEDSESRCQRWVGRSHFSCTVLGATKRCANAY